MNRFILIGLFAIFCEHVADVVVDAQFPAEPTGYSQQDRKAMDALLVKVLTPQHVSLVRPKTGKEWAAVVADIWNVDEREYRK